MKLPTFVAALVLAGLALFARKAAAQQYLVSGSAEVAQGVDIAGGLRQTRTRLRLGVDLSIDESPKDAVSAALIAEVEPRGSVGADLRYVRFFGERVMLNAGVIGILAPSSLYGATVGMKYRFPLAKSLWLLAGPEANFYFLGTDLPDGTVITQLLLQAGLRVDL